MMQDAEKEILWLEDVIQRVSDSIGEIESRIDSENQPGAYVYCSWHLRYALRALQQRRIARERSLDAA